MTDTIELVVNESNKDVVEKIIIGKQITDDNIATLFYSFYCTKYLYDQDFKTWYSIDEFGIYKKEHQDENLQSIKRILARKIQTLLEKEIENKIRNSPNKELEKNKMAIIKYIGTDKNKNSIIKSLKMSYGKDNISGKIDNVNKYIFGFTNGVYDLKKNCFRNALPEEYVSTTTGYEYAKPKKAYIKKVNKILVNIFPDTEERTHILKCLSLSLLGVNFFERFYVWMAPKADGQGANGKSLLAALLEKSFGNYFQVMNYEYLTKEPVANAPDEIGVSCKSSRIVFINEVPQGTIFNAAKVKALSGNDFVSCRRCHGAQFKYKPQFSMFFLSNHEIRIGIKKDEAIERRAEKHAFRNQFVDNPTLPHHRKIDRKLKNNFDTDIEYKLALIQILINHLNLFARDTNNEIITEMVPPDSIQKITAKFIAHNNPIFEFIKAKLMITNNINDKISSTKLLKAYQEFSQNKNITSKEFKHLITYKTGIPAPKKTTSCNVYCNLKFKTEETLNEFADVEFIKDDSDNDNKLKYEIATENEYESDSEPGYDTNSDIESKSESNSDPEFENIKELYNYSKSNHAIIPKQLEFISIKEDIRKIYDNVISNNSKIIPIQHKCVPNQDNKISKKLWTNQENKGSSEKWSNKKYVIDFGNDF